MREQFYHEQGYRYVFGIDEAGRGPMAGPLVAAAVCLPLDQLAALTVRLRGVKDSKQMTRLQRERAVEQIQTVAITWGIGEVAAREMPAIANMTQVTYLAMQRALDSALAKIAPVSAEVLLIDYHHLPSMDDVIQEPITRGETHSLSIAAASVLAKVHRDTLMIDYAKQYPEYAFEQHKGYPTPAHKAAILKHGICEIHRRNYAPIQAALSQSNPS